MIGFDGDIAGTAVAAGVAVGAAAAAGGKEGQAAGSDLAWEQVFPVRNVFGLVQDDEIVHDRVLAVEQIRQEKLKR